MANILAVDDEPTNLWLLSQILTAANHCVIEAPSVDHALQLYREHSIDLVITDLFMPEKNGLELISELLASYPDAKIIALAAGGQDVLGMAKGTGACQTLAKPFLRTDLLDMVHNLLLDEKADQ